MNNLEDWQVASLLCGTILAFVGVQIYFGKKLLKRKKKSKFH